MHLETFPEPASWRNDELAEKWERVRDVRRVVTGALEIERAAKRIGSSLEAAPEVYVGDGELLRRAGGRRPRGGVDHQRRDGSSPRLPPADAFTLPDVPGVGVVPKRAAGQEVRALLAHHCATSAPIRPFPSCRRAMPPPCASSMPAPRADAQ